jgi:hypothetical protein
VEIRAEKREKLEEQTDFRSRIRKIGGPAVVFVRYGPAHDVHHSLVQNLDDPARLRVWVVHDRGEENRKLLLAAPGRRPYLYDESRRSLIPLTTAIVGARERRRAA